MLNIEEWSVFKPLYKNQESPWPKTGVITTKTASYQVGCRIDQQQWILAHRKSSQFKVVMRPLRNLRGSLWLIATLMVFHCIAIRPSEQFPASINYHQALSGIIHIVIIHYCHVSTFFEPFTNHFSTIHHPWPHHPPVAVPGIAASKSRSRRLWHRRGFASEDMLSKTSGRLCKQGLKWLMINELPWGWLIVNGWLMTRKWMLKDWLKNG